MLEYWNIGKRKKRPSDPPSFHHSRIPLFQSSSAFTLVEFVVTMLIMAIVATVSIQVLVSTSTLYANGVASRQAETDVSLAMDRLVREVRRLSGSSTNLLVADSNTLSFINLDGDDVTFQLSGSNLVMNGNLLLSGVDVFSLDYYDSTNGLLSPEPLDLGQRRRVRAAGVNLSASSGWQAETLKTYVFWPSGGTRR